MKRVVKIFGFALCVFTTMHTKEYLYPVAHALHNDANLVFLIHQISLNRLQLLQLDVQSGVIAPVLPSAITPAGIKILPDLSGYSFIDQGSIYIKLFSKRSPIHLDISLPLYQIDMIEWIDPTCCYFAACYQDKSNIYQLSITGDLQLLVQSSIADSLYPQKIDDSLYYIERSFDKKKYCIKVVHYSPTHLDRSCSNNSTMSLLNTGDQPIAFLYMQSSTIGYYVSYPASLEGQAACLPCAYHQLSYDNKQATWNTEKLFDFSVPLDFLLPENKDRLYESFLPLLPTHTEQGIYFCDCTPDKAKKTGLRNLGGSWYEADFVKIYFYDFLSKKTTLMVDDNNQDLLAPFATGKTLLYGHSLTGTSKNKPLLPGMWHNERGQTCYEPAKVVIS